jgi:cation-transporting ATPase E
LISGLTIGLPSFVLALQPNHNIIKGKFMKNVILRAWPASLVTIINIIVLLIFYHNYSYAEYSTVAVMLTSLVGLMMVIRLSIPINPLRGALIAVVATGLALGIFVFGWLFDFVMLSGFSLTLFIVLVCVSVVLYNILYTISDKKLIK